MSRPIHWDKTPDWLKEKWARDKQAAEQSAAAEQARRLRSRRFRHWLKATARRRWPLLGIGLALGLWIGTTRTQAGRYELIKQTDSALLLDTATGDIRILKYGSGNGWQFGSQPLEDAPTPFWDWPDWDWPDPFVVLAWALVWALLWLLWRARRNRG